MIDVNKFNKYVTLDTEHIIPGKLLNNPYKSEVTNYVLGTTAIGDQVLFTPQLLMNVKVIKYTDEQYKTLEIGEVVNDVVKQIAGDIEDQEIIFEKVKNVLSSNTQPFVYLQSTMDDQQIKALNRLESAILQARSGKKLDGASIKFINEYFGQVKKVFENSEFAIEKSKIAGSEFAKLKEMIFTLSDSKDVDVITNHLKQITTLTELSDMLYDTYVKEGKGMIGYNVIFDITKLKDAVDVQIKRLIKAGGREEKVKKLQQLSETLVSKSKQITGLASETFTSNASQMHYALTKSIQMMKKAQEASALEYVDLLPTIRSLVSHYNKLPGTEAGFTLTEAIKIYLSDVSTEGAHSAAADVEMTNKLAKYFIDQDWDEIEKIVNGELNPSGASKKTIEFLQKLKVHGNVIKVSSDIKALKKFINMSFRNRDILESYGIFGEVTVEDMIKKGLLNEDDLKLLKIEKTDKFDFKAVFERAIKSEKNLDGLKEAKIVKFITAKQLSESKKTDTILNRIDTIIERYNAGKKASYKIERTNAFSDNIKEILGMIMKDLENIEIKEDKILDISDLIEKYKHTHLEKVIDKELVLKEKSLFQRFVMSTIDILKKRPKTWLIAGLITAGTYAYFNNNKHREEVVPGENYTDQTDIVTNVLFNYQNAKYKLDNWVEKQKIMRQEANRLQLLEYMKGKNIDGSIAYFKLRTSPDYKTIKKVPRANPHTIYRNRNKHREPLP